MAGGIYVNRPFSPNIKCIIFAFIMIFFYWLTARFSIGKPNYLLLPLIFIIAYVAMAWYDAVYNCDDPLRSGTSSIGGVVDSIFKKQLRETEYKDSVPDQEKIYQKNVYLFHLLLVAPLLGYVGVQGYRGKLNNKDLYVVILVVALSVVVYHGYRFFYPRQPCNIVKQSENYSKIPNNLETCSVCSKEPLTNKLLPIMDPKFNLRETAKHLILLEDHLFHKGKRCPDCILKHCYTIDAFLDEGITLDKDKKYIEINEKSHNMFRNISKNIEHDVKTKTLDNNSCIEYAQALRLIRKPLVELTSDL